MERDDVAAVDQAGLLLAIELESDELHAASFNSRAPKSFDRRSQSLRSAATAGWVGLASSRSGPISVTAAAASPFHCRTGDDTAERPGITLESKIGRASCRERV